MADGGLVIKVELAGIRREELELTAEAGQLRISGQRPDGCRGSKCNFLLMEINYGAFESVIQSRKVSIWGKRAPCTRTGFCGSTCPRGSALGKKPRSAPIVNEAE